MFLKEDIDLNTFLERVQQCEGDIYFHTNEGDLLTLSQLCPDISLLLWQRMKMLP